MKFISQFSDGYYSGRDVVISNRAALAAGIETHLGENNAEQTASLMRRLGTTERRQQTYAVWGRLGYRIGEFVGCHKIYT